ncbi:MAG: M28 family peptidase [Deltaproteobacteria bacterium]|nr:M28 family peptidase [Deltaproteobacteria bacterium]
MSSDFVFRSANLQSDLETLCTFGGRFAGSDSEAKARDFLKARLAQATSRHVDIHRVPYNGWSRDSWALKLLAPAPLTLHSHPLVRSPSTPPEGIEAEVVDLGRGTLEDFEAHGYEIAGRFVLVRHEYMFSTTHIHRRVKYGWAKERGAAGFLIASHIPDDIVVTGSSGGEDIPALGITHEGAEVLARGDASFPRIHLTVKTRTGSATAENLIAEMPGQTDEWVVVCAHYDGHDLAQSAIDNATGVAAALTVAETFVPMAATLRRGLRVIFFTIEEWGLLGSRAYVDELNEAERRKITLVINLDSLVGGSKLTALTSEFEELNAFVDHCARKSGTSIATHPPMMANSDHYNFARHGIPALRLVSGFNEPDSDLGYLLTAGDTLDRINKDQLTAATKIAASMVHEACTHQGIIARHKEKKARV